MSATADFSDLPFIGGDLRVQLQWTHLVENTTVDATGVSDDYVGQCYDFGESCFNRDRSTGLFTWSSGDWTVNWVTRFMSGISAPEDALNYFDVANGGANPYTGAAFPAGVLEDVMDTYSIEDFYYHNASVSYQYDDNTRVNVAITNVFDEEAPYYKSFFGFVDPQINTPQNTYDIVGQYVTASVSYSF